jgi:hypothetical protein
MIQARLPMWSCWARMGIVCVWQTAPGSTVREMVGHRFVGPD